LRADYGLPADPDFTAPSRYLVLSPFPASLRDPAHPPPPTTHFFRSLPGAARDAPDEVSPRERVGAPTVYLTLGTEFNTESGDLFDRAIAGLRQLPINLVVTVGRDIDPAEFGPQPTNVRIERYLPQGEVLPACDLVVCHGGSGTLVGALSHGLPMVVLAMGADQPANARRCDQLGLGMCLDPVRATSEEIRDTAAAVLADSNYRLAAQKVQAEIEAQASPASAVVLLEQVAAERRPLKPRASKAPLRCDTPACRNKTGLLDQGSANSGPKGTAKLPGETAQPTICG